MERNPVKAGIVKKAEDYAWSSAKAHVYKKRDEILADNFVVDEISDWREYLSDESDDEKGALFVRHVDTGRPLGDEKFIKKIEGITGRILQKNKPGPSRKDS